MPERRVLHDVSWSELERLLQAKGERRVPLFAYLDGTLELMSPSHDHEWITRQIEQLLLVYAIERGIEVSGLGSWTLRSRINAAGIEPDNCYVFGPTWRGRRRPDLAIEVAWSRGGLAKLEIYRRLHVPEIWVWKRGAIQIYALRKSGYSAVDASRFVHGIDLRMLCRFIDRPTTSDAVRAYCEALRRRT
jgi:Uma2 family endonuclease